MKKCLTALVAASTALILLTACAQQPGGGGGGTEHLIMATGGAAGTYYPFGGVIASVVTANVEGVNITANTSGASVANARALNNGDVELALMQNDVMYYAFTGTEIMSDDDPIAELRTIATLYPEVVQLVATASSGITSVNDLRGMRVVVGDAGSGTEANAMHVLGSYGITLSDIGTVENLSFGEASTAMQNGNIDAAFVTAGAPTPAIVELNANMNIVLVPIEGAAAAGLISQFPFYTVYEISNDAYGIPGVTTVAVRATLATTTALSEDTVYAITRAMFENQSDIAIGHARGNELNPYDALSGISVPLHPGAERFFRAEGYIN
ncbi:MAG: TAXI family TRAP transporter solute-binding subunit [Defluviitaleaceae bacterium]|nr:TAXI family TRAP transporter solute-binding subunit [Defluviitaleaceae bacterium]